MPRTDAEARPRDSLLERFPQWTLAHWCVVVAASAFLLLAIHPEARLNDFDVPNGGESVRIARSLASHWTFADPFAVMKTGATAHIAPAYPFFYSLVLRLFGTRYTALLILWTFNLAFLSLQLGLLPLLSHRLGFGILPGIIGALLGTVSLYAPVDTRWECFLAGLLSLLAFLVTRRSFQQAGWVATLAAGALWGVLILTNPVTLLLLLVWPLCWLMAAPKLQRAKSLQRCALIATVALLVVSPWIARNYARFGAFVFVRDNLGLELYTSNNSCAAPSVRENIASGCQARTHPNPNVAVAAELAAAGELRFNRAKLRQALNWIAVNRAAFLSLSLRRFRLFWFPEADRAWEAAAVWIVTLLSFAGLWFMAKQNRLAAALIGIAWLSFPLIYYAIQFEARYRYPIYWTTLLPAGCAVAEILRRFPSARMRSLVRMVPQPKPQS